MAVLNFTKMHGSGNDFVLIDGRKEELKALVLKELAIDMCDRHFGAGADGLLIVWPSDRAHYRMQIINSDGSEAEMCGNGARCFTKYVYETDKLQEEEIISIETPAGIILPAVILGPDKSVAGVEVDMGPPRKLGEIELEGHLFKKVSMGNPHAVAFVDALVDIDIGEIGPLIENDPHFPDRTNVEFVQILNDKELKVLVWERGAGETLACGTGACAALFASGLRRAIVHLPGGDLDIELNEEGRMLLRGPAKTVYEGKYYL